MRKMKAALAIGALGCTMALSACSVGPEDIPISASTDNGYDLTLEFTSVLNLPAGAYVMMDGLKVGEVESLDVSGPAVAVTVNVKSDTEVPTDVRAIIRQNTLLGDTYVALDRSRSRRGGEVLGEGGIVPVAQTTSPPQLEDTIAVVANFVNGGSIQKVEEVIAKMNHVMPAQDNLQQLASVAAGDLRDLADNTGEIDRMLDGFSQTAVAIDSQSAITNTVFAPEAMRFWYLEANNIVSYVATVLPSIGSIFEGGMWLVPLLESVATDVDSGRIIWDGGAVATESVSNFVRTTLLPFLQQPSVNIKSVEVGANDAALGDVGNLLRGLGAVR